MKSTVFLRLIRLSLLLVALILLSLSTACASGDVEDPGSRTGEALYIPPILDAGNADLVVTQGTLRLPVGSSDTLGYNGNYLGPTLRASRGDILDIRIDNTLAEETTVHWHGMHLPAEFDGGPHQVIPAGDTWEVKFPVDQNAATLWYHPHLMGKTAEQVYRGLAGLFIIDDDNPVGESLPADYGVNDIPLVLQDRRVDTNGSFRYEPSMPDVVHGYGGNILLTNGQMQPTLERGCGTYRFRIVNGSNSSIMYLYASDGRNFTVIASDGGYLPNSLSTDVLPLAPGERFEILLDIDDGDDFSLMTEMSTSEAAFRVLNILQTDCVSPGYIDHPDRLSYEPVDPSQAVAQRFFVMETGPMGTFSINGLQMDMSRIDVSVQAGSTELWTITADNMGMMTVPHSFHVHDVQFTVLSINRSPPPPLYAGPKDTVLVLPGWEVVIAIQFGQYPGIYMYHCHFLEHEDNGMMGQFEVRSN